MNDIEILEDKKEMFIDTLYECYRQSEVKPFEKALENLIKENTELRIQISARETVVDELEKENKELKERINKSIEFINDDDTFFNDGESWQNVLHIERILKGE